LTADDPYNIEPLAQNDTSPNDIHKIGFRKNMIMSADKKSESRMFQTKLLHNHSRAK
jgi:hypothetical protein